MRTVLGVEKSVVGNYLAAVVVASVLLCAIGMIAAILYQGLSLTPFREELNIDKAGREKCVEVLFLPAALAQAEDFDLGVLDGIDGGEHWIRAQFSESVDFQAFIEQLDQMRHDAHYANYRVWTFDRPASHEAKDIPGRPAEYADPSESTPGWWYPDDRLNDIAGIYFGLQVVKASPVGTPGGARPGVAEGVCIFYSRSSRTVWVWEWIRQHFSFDHR